MKKRLVLAPIVFALAACNPSPPATPEAVAPAELAGPSLVPALGMLEERLGATTTEPRRFVVRLMFQNDGAAWKSLDPSCADVACLNTATARLPPSTAWTIVHAGEVKGSVTATTPAKWALYGDVGTQDLAASALPPTVGQPTLEFSADGSTPVNRPLVAISTATVSDPDAWKAGSLSPAMLAALRASFRTQFAAVSNCATDGGTDPKPMTYTDADIIPSAVSVSAKGWSVATTQLADYRCDGPWDDTAFAPQTFAISPDGKVQHLGENLKLVDAGDFDGNGKSELIFALQAGNTGGYTLRFDDFVGEARFAFNYH
jgi:hypothetical protein